VVTRLFEITHAERAGWQRLAANTLVAILDEHRSLPRVSWTVAATGCTLVGAVGHGDAAGVRTTFDGWCAALAVVVGGVKVILTAVVNLGDHECQGVTS
jgi:hypothetical protein